jgi:hypothetical protein
MSASPALAVIKREFLTGLRSPKPFLFLAVLMLIMITGLVFMMGVVIQDTLRYGGALGSRDVRGLFMMFSFGLYISAMLLVPPMAAVSICIEKQQDSYDLLRMTYITPFALAMAKLFNVLGIYTLISVATLPIVGVFFFLVGIDWAQFVQSAVIVALSTLSCAVIGLACSAKFYRTLPAIMTTYVIGFLFQGGILLFLVLATEMFWTYTWINEFFNEYGMAIVSVMCPMASLGILAEGRLSSIPLNGGYYSLSPLLLVALYHGVIILAGLKVTLGILKRPTEPMKVDQEKPIDNQAELEARRKSFPFYLIDPRRRRPTIPDGANPLYHKELQTGLLGKGTFGVRVFYGFTIFCLVVASFAVAGGDFGIRDLGSFVAWPLLIDTIVILILTPSLVAMAMSKEHEWSNLDMLRMTLLEPGQIVQGKFRTGLYTAMIPMLGAFLGSIPLAFFGWHSSEAWAAAVAGFGTLAVCVVYTLALTLAVTATCKRGLTALLLGYGTSIGALVLLPLVLLFLTAAVDTMVTGRASFSEEVVKLLSYSSPLSAQLVNIESSGGYNRPELFNLYWLTNVTLFMGIALLLFRWAGRRFDRHLRHGLD